MSMPYQTKRIPLIIPKDMEIFNSIRTAVDAKHFPHFSPGICCGICQPVVIAKDQMQNNIHVEIIL